MNASGGGGGCVRRDGEPAVRPPLRPPELQLGRQELPLPRLRPDGEAETGLVVAPLEPVAARLLHVGVADGQIVGGLEHVVDDRAASNRRPDDEESAIAQDSDEPGNAFQFDDRRLAGDHRHPWLELRRRPL